MRKKIFGIVVVFVTLFTLNLTAEQLSKIGIINFSKIIEDYFAESTSWREIDDMRAKYEKGKDAILDQINELKVKKLEAENNDNQSIVLKLEDQIYNKQEYLKEFHSVWQTRINNKIKGVYQSSTFTAEILDAIEYVGETEGYSLILRSQDEDILWYNNEVDVTGLVLDRLKQITRTEN